MGMKPSRKKRKQMKEKANAKVASKSAGSIKKKRRKVTICFHFTPPVFYIKGGLSYYEYELRHPDVYILSKKMLDELQQKLKEREQPFYNKPAKSRICQNEKGEYVCKVCGTKFSKLQWVQMDAVVEFLNEGGTDEKKLKTLYSGLCPARYYRTPEGELVTEKVEEEVEIPGKCERVEMPYIKM